jgi:hypothetical protein
MFNSKKVQLVVLGVTALVLSRLMFWLFNDPEGPNLLVVTVFAAIVYLLSFAVYKLNRSVALGKKLLLTIFTQAVIVACFYYFLK